VFYIIGDNVPLLSGLLVARPFQNQTAAIEIAAELNRRAALESERIRYRVIKVESVYN
jgi:hypothetical protein